MRRVLRRARSHAAASSNSSAVAARLALATGLMLAFLCATVAQRAAAADQVISSAGPLTNIYIGEELGCQVDHLGDEAHEFFPPFEAPGSCGTVLVVGGERYGYSGSSFTPVSQSAVSGSGTSAEPFRVVTTATAGTTGLEIVETDSYVVGEASYKTDIELRNTSASSLTFALFHTADCYLNDSDSGYGYYNQATGAVYCSTTPNDSPAGGVVGFVPESSGSSYLESLFPSVEDLEDAQLPDTCDCETYEDNGAGLSWSVTLPAGGSETRSLLTTFSPTTAAGGAPAGTSTPAVSTTSSGSGNASSGVDASTSSAPPAPALGRTADVQVTSGTVLVRLPGSRTFTALTAALSVPLGTVVDATNGTVTLLSATDASGHTETGQFSGGIFRVGQARGPSQLHGGKVVEFTLLTLVGAPPSGCGAKGASFGGRVATAHKSRHLWGNAHGNFRTEGRYASATVRGTKWLTEDTCAGTLVRVARGVVAVDDLAHHRTVLVTAPHSFLSHPGAGG